MNDADTSAVTLRALAGEPLKHAGVRDMVIAAARGIAERQGVELVDVNADATRVTVIVRGPRIVALGLAAELRRLTSTWYASKYGHKSLWGEGPDAAADQWKRQ